MRHEPTIYQINLAQLMRKHGVTIRELSYRTGITMGRIRQLRRMTHMSYCVWCDLVEAITGVNVFSRAVYDLFAV